MELTRTQQEQIAALVHSEGYQLLLALFTSSEQDAQDAMLHHDDPAKLLRAARYWQFLRRVSGWLRTAPATIADELTRLRQDGLLEDYPISRGQAWRGRFIPLQEEEEEMIDPANI